MFQSISNALRSPGFSLRDLPEFPYNEYYENLERYDELESWFSGEALEATQEQASKEIDVYPLRINPIRSAAYKHAYALWGEFPEDSSAWLAPTRPIYTEEKDRTAAEIVEKALFDVWHNNNGAALQMENGTISQVYGGCVFKVSWDGSNKRVRIEIIHPKEFVGIPYYTNMWSLKEAWVVRKIDKKAALEYDIDIYDDEAYYIEMWTPSEYQILINNQPIIYENNGAKKIFGGTNPFGFVPFIYIPHQRSGSGFYGDSMITDAAIGIVKEQNLRVADAGDAVNDESHSILAMRNVRGTPGIVKLANRISVVNLGSNQTVTGTPDQPDLFAVNRSSVSTAMLNLTSELQNQFRREVMVPAVAEGEDEGSQRSALTLSVRMWPLTSHTKSERALWTTGLIRLNEMILNILFKKGKANLQKEHLDYKLKVKWYPILPRDQQAFVEEIVARSGVNLGSPEHLLQLLGDVDDIEMVMRQMRDWIQFQAQVKTPPPQVEGGTNGSQSDSGGPEETLRDG